MVPFVYLASVCQSLQCLISALTQAGRGGFLFRFAGSVLLWGGRGPAGRYLCVWVALTVFWPHWVCPRSPVCAFPVCTAQAPGCCIWSVPCVECSSSFRVFHKSADSVAPVFCAFPSWSSSGSQELDGRILPGCGVPSPLHGPSLSFRPRQSGACALCLAATLPADVDHPESQEVFG